MGETSLKQAKPPHFLVFELTGVAVGSNWTLGHADQVGMKRRNDPRYLTW